MQLCYQWLVCVPRKKRKKKEKEKEKTKERKKQKEKKEKERISIEPFSRKKKKKRPEALTLLDEVCYVLVFLEVLCGTLVEEDQEGINESVKVQLVVQCRSHHLPHLQQTGWQLASLISHIWFPQIQLCGGACRGLGREFLQRLRDGKLKLFSFSFSFSFSFFFFFFFFFFLFPFNYNVILRDSLEGGGVCL